MARSCGIAESNRLLQVVEIGAVEVIVVLKPSDDDSRGELVFLGKGPNCVSRERPGCDKDGICVRRNEGVSGEAVRLPLFRVPLVGVSLIAVDVVDALPAQ